MVYAYKLKAILHTIFPSHSRRGCAGGSGNAKNGSYLNGRRAAEWTVGQAGCAGRSGNAENGSYLNGRGATECALGQAGCAGGSGNAVNGSYLNGRRDTECALGQAGCAGGSGNAENGSYLTRAGRREWMVTGKPVLAVRTRAVRCAPRPFVRTAASREYVSCAPDGFSRTGSASCARHTSLHGLHGQLRFTQTFLRRAPVPFYRHSSPPALTQNPSAHSRAHGGDAKQRRAEKRMKQE